MILEKILEQSGLVKGREFTMQESMQDAEGNRLRTDVIIKLPDERNIIIDSKVSLTDYDRFMKADDADEQEAALQRHVRSVKGHVDILHKKSYADYPGSPEFIFHVHSGGACFHGGHARRSRTLELRISENIILIGPTNPDSSIEAGSRDLGRKNTRAEMPWRSQIVRVPCMTNLPGSRKACSMWARIWVKAGESYDKALSQLKDGKGNLIGRVEQLRKLGAKNKKQLDQQLLLPDDDIQDDD